MHTLLEILEGVETNGKLTFHGTNIEYLNDRTEYLCAINVMIELFKKYEENGLDIEGKLLSKKMRVDNWKTLASNGNLISSPFITSFSDNPDSLPMWNTYADKGKGIAIGLIKDTITEYDSQTGKPIWGKCIYDNKLYSDNMNKTIDDIYRDIKVLKNGGLRIGKFSFNNLAPLFSILKDKNYAYENEYRLIKTCAAMDKDKEVHFKEVEGMLKPYYNFILPKDTLREIRLGPCSNMEMSKKSVEMCLERAEYNSFKLPANKKVKVIPSEIPFRNI